MLVLLSLWLIDLTDYRIDGITEHCCCCCCCSSYCCWCSALLLLLLVADVSRSVLTGWLLMRMK
jgi:hypothetical protein